MEGDNMSEVKTIKELYEYCVANNAEDYEIVIEERRNVNKDVGVWIVTKRQEVLIVIPNQK